MAVHRNILRLRGFCITPTERLLVYPFMPNGSVASRLGGTVHEFYRGTIFNIKLYLEYISFFQEDVLKLWKSGFLFVANCKVEIKLNCFNLKQST